jgi:rhodanese-related sulfurtransferase
MLNINSPSPRRNSFSVSLESPTFTNSLRSNSFSTNFHNALKRPLVHNTGHNTNNDLNINNNNKTNNNHYKINANFTFSSLNKENIPQNLNNNNNNNNTNNNNNNNNVLYKSLSYNGSPISNNSSIKKHLRKKSTSSLFKSNQSSLFHSNNNSNTNNTHFRSRSQSTTNNNHNGHNNNHHSNIHSHNISRNNSHRRNKSHNSIGLFSLKHAKSNSSISSNTIFKNLSSKPSIDSIFNFSNESYSLNSKPLFTHSNNNFIFSSSIQLTPNRSDTESYYSSDENISDHDKDHANLSNISYDNESDVSNNDILDLGSPLQKKQSNINNLKSRIKHFKLQRHQSLMQFSNNNKNFCQNYNFETDQLTSNINGLSVKSDDDDFAGNSVLNDVPFNFITNENSKIPRINVLEFKNILNEYQNRFRLPNKKFCKHFDELIIVDCRFKFEYDGGHIDGAINISSFDELENAFFDNSVLNQSPLELNSISRKLIIFHCEFSSVRGPTKANQLRAFDRQLSGEFYPNLYYPDIVVLEGGYKDYYESEKNFHTSLKYIEMNHPLFKDECDRNLDLFRKEKEISRKNSRSSSCVSLSRKTSHSSIKSISSSTILDYPSVNKLEFGQARPSKRFLPNINSSSSIICGKELKQTNDYESFSILTPKEDGIFGGFGNNSIDLDNLADKAYNNEDDDFDEDQENEDFDDMIDRVDHSILQSNVQTLSCKNLNDGFKVPSSRNVANRRNTIHSRSKTVSTFSFSNHSGFKSAPLLTTPEKSEAKYGVTSVFQHSDVSVYSVKECIESEFEDDTEYVSIYSQKNRQRHFDTPVAKSKRF